MALAASTGSPCPVVHIADHDPRSRDALCAVLSSVGFETRLFATVDELLGCRPGPGPSCLVMEYRLQGMNGLELRSRLLHAGIPMPVIFMSAHADIPIAVRAIKAGAVDFLTKPVRTQDVLDAVHTALEWDAALKADLRARGELEVQLGCLTQREREVMWHVTAGLMNKQVAGLLGLSEITVKVHRSNVMRKMGARSLADLIAKANVLAQVRAQDESRGPLRHAADRPRRALPATFVGNPTSA
ncbi:MAG TPA: LuxR C-terminal-related transcriptional regulator [Microvirga sp.]|jgi:FixJ family two-component response regulator|nr:LuxR C-terminal-related transcriptional regulator [Microvirga sp.]